MSTLTKELEQTLNALDGHSAVALERLVRDAIALARPAKVQGTPPLDAKGWPTGYFEKTAGCFAGEPFDIPGDPPPSSSPDW